MVEQEKAAGEYDLLSGQPQVFMACGCSFYGRNSP